MVSSGRARRASAQAYLTLISSANGVGVHAAHVLGTRSKPVLCNACHTVPGTQVHKTGVATAGKHAVVVGRSLIVGKPAAVLLLAKGCDCTVTIAHSRTQDLAAIVRQADIVVAAIGKPRFITADMVKPGAVVIDVGINRVPDATKKTGYRIVGDVEAYVNDEDPELSGYQLTCRRGAGG